MIFNSSIVHATVTSAGAEQPYGSFITGAGYEYMMGTNFVLDNNYYSTRLNNSDPTPYITTSNLRDKSTAIRNTDRRGWQFYGAYWLTYSLWNTYNRNGTAYPGFNEYVFDSYDPTLNGDVIQGIQDGGAAIYTDDGVTYNRYRRAVIMIYRRPLATVSQDAAYINSVDLSGGYNTYGNGSTLWIPANKQTDMRTISCAIGDSGNGQLGQYAENIENNYIFARSADSSIWLELYTDGRNGSYAWYNSHSTGWQYINGVSIFQRYEYGNAINWSTYKQNGMGSQATYTFPDNEDITWKFDAADKYGVRQSAYYTSFNYGSNPYTTLSTDGTPPGLPSVGSSVSNAWTSSNVSVGLNAEGYDTRSGTSYSQFRIDGGTWNTYSGWFTVSSEGWHNVDFRSIDHVGNIGDYATVSFGIDKTAPAKSSSTITGAQYVNGSDYWVKPLTNVSVYTRISDNLSGVAKTYLRNYSYDATIDNRMEHDWNTHSNNEWMTSPYIKITNAIEGYNTTNVKDTTFTVQPQNYDKDYYIQTAAYDYVNNLYGFVTLGNLRVDGTAPTVNSSITSGGLLKGIDSVTLTYADSRSGVATKQWAWATNTITPTIWNSYTGTIVPNMTGTYYLHYKCVDNVGNTTTSYFGPYNIYDNNLRADSIVIQDMNGNVVTQLTQNINYKAKISFTNTGTTNLSNFTVGLYENGASKGTDALISNIAAGASTTVNIQFTATTTGSKTYLAKVDNTDVIRESNENDNTVSTNASVQRVNLKAQSIDITDLSGASVSGYLIQNKDYYAKITFINDSTITVNNFTVGLYENGTSKGTNISISSIAAGALTTVNIKFNANNRGNFTYMANVDNGNVIEESDETDNTVLLAKTVNKVNIKAIVLDIVDTKGVPQTSYLIKGLQYTAKIQLINDGDVNIVPFNLGLYDTGTRIASLPISNLNMSATSTVYSIPFIPANTGARSFMAFADYDNKIDESIETDNQVYNDIVVNDLQLVNFRITDMVNPPTQYTFPIGIANMPADCKSGYKITLKIDSIGLSDKVEAQATLGGVDGGLQEFTKISETSNSQVWQLDYIVPLDTSKDTIVNFAIKGYRGTYIYDYNLNNSFSGDTLNVIGSALEDVNINRIY